MNPHSFDKPHLYPVFKTTLVLSLRDGKTNRELFENDIEGLTVMDRGTGLATRAIIMNPDLPRAKKYWKASFDWIAPKVRLQVFGGASYKDMMMDIVVNTKRRFMNVLVVMERRS